jgi:rhodanese-related sulfurtransferase
MSLTKINSQQLKEMIEKKESFILVDVRELHEYKSGHLAGAIHKPLSRFLQDPLPDHQSYVFYCRSGYRSEVAAEHLLQLHHDLTIYNLAGGLTDWINHNYPIVID